MDFNPCPKPPPKKKKPKTGIRQVSQKQQRHNRERQSTYLKMDSKPMFCQGCGTTYGLSHSHRISQRDKRHVANTKAIDFYCLGENSCHTKYECGFLWDLDNAVEVLEWLESTDHERFMTKIYKMCDRIKESDLSIENLPGWVGELLLRLEIKII